MAVAREEREVQIMHMKSPSSFWVTDSELLQDSEQEHSEVVRRERALARIYNRSKQYTKLRTIMPNEGELVAVRHPNTMEWHRGKIEYVLETSSGYEYQIFLVDHGYPLKKIKTSAIHELPSEFKEISFAAYEVVLDDLVPLTLQMDFLYQKMVPCVADSWPVAAWNFMEKLVGQGRPAVLKINCIKNKVVFGDLFLNGTISISEILCEEEYAIRSRSDFEKVYRQIQDNLPNYHHNLEDKRKTLSEVKTQQKFLVDYVQEMENRQNLPNLQEIKEKAGYLSDEDCSLPSVGRGVTRKKKESSVGILANSKQQERKRVPEVGRSAPALSNSSENERETCDSEDGLRKLSVECKGVLSVGEAANSSNTGFPAAGETSPRNEPVGIGAEGNTSATESIDKDGDTSADSNSTVSFYLKALSKTKQVKSPSQNGASTSVAEKKESISSNTTVSNSFNTNGSCDETKKRQRAFVKHNQASKSNGNKTTSASSRSSENNSTDSCDEMQKESTNYNRTNNWALKDNSNQMQLVNVNKSDKASQNASAESTNVRTRPQETERMNKDDHAATNYSPTCLLYLQALSKAKPVNETTSNVPQSDLPEKTVPESTEMRTIKKAQLESFSNSDGCDYTRKAPTNHLVSKDNCSSTESVNNILSHETAKLSNNISTTIKETTKVLAGGASVTTSTSATEGTNDRVHMSSNISATCSMFLEAISKAKHVKQPTQSTPPSELPRKKDTPDVENSTPDVENSNVRTNNQMLPETLVINRNDSCEDKTKEPREYNVSKQSVSKDNGSNSDSTNNRLHEIANKSSHNFPTKGKTSPKNESGSLSTNTSGTDSTIEEGYASTGSSLLRRKPQSKANLVPQNRTQETQLSVAENRSSNLISARAASKTLGDLVSGESLTAFVRILVHGDVRVKPIQSIYEANFPKEVHGALTKMGFRVPYRIQKYAWPAILRGQNTILVGPRSSGKTIACLVPLLSFMIMKETYCELRMGSGPYVVILCSGCKSAQQAYETCETILALAGQGDVTVLVAYGGGQELQLKTQLVNGCDILISTPKCLLRLLRYSKYMTNLNRLVHLFLDEVDVLAFKYLPEVKEIISECKLMLKDRAKLQMPVQVLAASEKWTIAVEQFAKNISKNFFVCISGYLEAAVYAKLQPKLHFETAEMKPSAVLNILEGSQGMFKVVVVCQYVQEVESLLQYFKQDTLEVLCAHENVSHDTMMAIKREWKYSTVPGNHPILVCTDGVLPDLEIYDAMWLIHYSMPYTKTAFGFRFSCLMDNYNNMFKTTKDDPDKPYCSVHIFLEDTSETKELPEVVRFIKRSGVSVDPVLEMKAAKVEKEKELSKSGVPLCYNLKAFGDCWESSTCRSRHVIQAEDKPKNIPVSGEVTIKVLTVIDASRFAARILDHKDNSNAIKTYPDNYFAVAYEVMHFYGNKDNRIPHGAPKLGDLCAVEVVINKFYRAKVTEIVMSDKHNLPKLVNVYLLDEGTTEEVKVSQLLELPDKLKEAIPQVVEVFLCNIMPCDKDWSWSVMATCRMTDWMAAINEKQDEDRCLRGQIKLSLGNTLWLDPLECCTYLENVNSWVKDSNLSRDLVAVKLAVKNPDHMKRLYQLCEEGGIVLPDNTKQETVAVPHPHRKAAPKQPQWAYLDKEEYQQVSFVSAENPYRVFVRLLKFQDSLQRLTTELQQNTDDSKDFQAEAGMYCIAKFVEEDKWNRAKVLEVLDNKKVKVFYVDHGDIGIVDADQVAAIREKYVTKLPFQAIECSLIGVKPREDGDWSEEVIDAIYDFGDNSTLFVKVCQTERISSLTGGKLYKVIMVDTSTSADLVLNKMLVEKGLAVFVEDEMKLLEDVAATKEAKASACEEEVKTLSSAPQPSKNHSNSIASLDFNFGSVSLQDIETFVKYFGLMPDEEEDPKVKKNAVEDDHKLSKNDIVSVEEEDEDDGPPALVSRTKIPHVIWYQNECLVHLRIMLAGIQKYHLAWDVTTLEFCAEVMEDTYSVKMEFYAGMEPENLVHICKGLYLQITLRKINKGDLWPRLVLSGDRYLWIKKDLQMFKQESESEEEHTAASYYRKALSRKTIPKKAVRVKKGEHIVPDALALESDECESDPWEPAEETVDFYDPLG